MKVVAGFILVAVVLLGGCRAREDVDRTRGAALALVAPEAEVIRVGDTERIPVLVDRAGFTGPVTLQIGPLPEGVELVEREVIVGADARRVTFSLHATPEARPVQDFAVAIRANAENLPAITETVRVSIVPQAETAATPREPAR